MRRRNFLTVAASTAVGGCLSELPGTGPPIDVDCPSFSEGVDPVCAHTASNPPLVLRPSSWKLPKGSGVALTFTVSNEADATARVTSVPSLKRRTDDGWKHQWPMVKTGDASELEPGATYSWEFDFYREETTRDTDENVGLYALEAGTYAAVVGAKLGDRSLECIAPFEVEASGDE